MVEIIQQIGASGLVAMPTEQELAGPLADDIRKYYQAARAEAFDRIPLFRLAWDTALSAFGARQVLYERFFFGDPVRMAGAPRGLARRGSSRPTPSACASSCATCATKRSGAAAASEEGAEVFNINRGE